MLLRPVSVVVLVLWVVQVAPSGLVRHSSVVPDNSMRHQAWLVALYVRKVSLTTPATVSRNTMLPPVYPMVTRFCPAVPYSVKNSASRLPFPTPGTCGTWMVRLDPVKSNEFRLNRLK